MKNKVYFCIIIKKKNKKDMRTEKEIKSIENMPKEKRFWYLKHFYEDGTRFETDEEFYEWLRKSRMEKKNVENVFYHQQTCESRRTAMGRDWTTKANCCQKRNARKRTKKLKTRKNRTQFKREAIQQINEYLIFNI